MKLIAGKNLQQCLARFKNQPEAIVRLVVKVAEAIHHAHERGVLHRDLKPSNILVDDHDEPYVIDFGLAKCWRTKSRRWPRPVRRWGRPATWPPSRPRGCATRSPPRPTSTAWARSFMHYYGSTTVPSRHRGERFARYPQGAETPPRTNPQVDLDLETICLKCLQKDPKKRYASARELAEDLHRWRAGKPILARPNSTTERVWKYARRHPVTSALIGMLVLTATLGGGGIVWQWRQAVAAREGMQLALGVASERRQ